MSKKLKLMQTLIPLGEEEKNDLLPFINHYCKIDSEGIIICYSSSTNIQQEVNDAYKQMLNQKFVKL